MEEKMKILVFFASLAISAWAYGQSVPSCPTHEAQGSSDAHSAGVDTRGDQAMGFSHEKSAHHFRLFSDGGAIEISTKESNDTVTRDEIRTHLSHIAEMFTAGHFQLPMFIHDTVPPGVPVMESKRSAISYLFESMPNGGRIRIMTSDKDALEAIHQFLVFQIADHRTADSNVVTAPN
jgi:hypothetical protein